MPNKALHLAATRVTFPAWSLRFRQEARHGQPYVSLDVIPKYSASMKSIKETGIISTLEDT